MESPAVVLQLVPRCSIDKFCRARSVVVVQDATGDEAPGCEQHAAELLNGLWGAKIAKVWDWEATRRLLELPWNRRGVS